jgi:hypothetical protein
MKHETERSRSYSRQGAKTMKRYRTTNDDDADFEIVNGRKILRDGHRYRRAGGLLMMDSSPCDLRQPSRRPLIVDAGGKPHGLSQPGWRIPAQDARSLGGRVVNASNNRAARQAAYDSYHAALESAWKHPAGLGDADLSAYGAGETGRHASGNESDDEGAPCTCKGGKYVEYFGSPGHIKNGICVPDDLDTEPDDDDDEDAGTEQQTSDANRTNIRAVQQAHSENMEQLYSLRDAELESAWRGDK